MSIAIYTLTSGLHNEDAVAASTREMLGSLHTDCVLRGDNYVDYGHHALDLIFVRTGGTEGVFRRLLPQLQKQSARPFRLLTSGKNNSLAASLEILSYLRQQGLRGEVIHGEPDYVARRISLLSKTGEIVQRLNGQRLGIIGQPSDWLIASHADKDAVRQWLGIDLIDIEMQELIEAIPSAIHDAAPQEGAMMIYETLKAIVIRHQLHGFTLRCFDLLTSVHNTGCLALAKLNAEGLVAGCEGDVPALLSMAIARAATGVSGFQANPARINVETGELLLAHCTIPLDMVSHYELDTHFESGIGVGIRGFMEPGDVTLLKVSGDTKRHFIAEGQLLRNQAEPDLCRTQQIIRLNDASQAQYFLTNPIGNHHIVLPGHIKEVLTELFAD